MNDLQENYTGIQQKSVELEEELALLKAQKGESEPKAMTSNEMTKKLDGEIVELKSTLKSRNT